MDEFANSILIGLEELFAKDEIKTLARPPQGTATVDPAIKIIHLPTKTEVDCAEYNSQVKNKAVCLVRLALILKRKALPPNRSIRK